MKMTNGIPVCPNCGIATKRSAYNCWTTTDTQSLVITYDEEGNPMKDDKSKEMVTIDYECHRCNQPYTVLFNGKNSKYI